MSCEEEDTRLLHPLKQHIGLYQAHSVKNAHQEAIEQGVQAEY